MARYAAFLRGINVGGNKKVPMAKLASEFLTMGFENVKTLLASGNVIFEGEKEDTKKIEARIAKKLGEAKLDLAAADDIDKHIPLFRPQEHHFVKHRI
jgi:uncharacterized protein (DUF1697 family)